MRTDIRTFADDLEDLRRGTVFLGALLAIPLAGVLGLPLLTLLLLLFILNPGGWGQRLSQCQPLKNIPGFRSGSRVHMALASLLYLLPLSCVGIIVIGVDGVILRIFP